VPDRISGNLQGFAAHVFERTALPIKSVLRLLHHRPAAGRQP
jgi:hypothetical protein